MKSNKEKGDILPKKKDEYGFSQVELEKDGVKTTHDVHMLMAKTFVPNPNNFKYVIHIDGNRENNKANNLRWVASLK